MFNYIDLFSGAGGFSLGLNTAGFKNIFSIDYQKEFCDTYRANFPKHHLIQRDISQLGNEEILTIIGNNEIDVIVGGPPCQGFSMAGIIGRKFIDDERNHLFNEFVRIVNVVKPKIFVLENVARLYIHNKGETRKEIIAKFSGLGYNVTCKVLNTADYGVPQIRNRVIFIGNRIDVKNLFPEKSVKVHITVKEELSKYPATDSLRESIPNHVPMKHSAQMLKKMSYVQDGGNRNDIPLALRPLTGDIRKYIKYDSSKPSICITGDMRKVFHYEYNRALTVRELAGLQSFPMDFIFKGNTISQQQQVGNAVPPKFAAAISKSIKEMLSNG
ncbi:MAG: DNA (cytosine-5-)-methyltransferase [Bacteroidota bacterium]